MDQLKDTISNFTGGSGDQQQQGGDQNQQGGGSGGGGGFLGGIGDKLNEVAGGGKSGEAKEDYLDKAVDVVQEKVLGQGAQDNENAVEQAKDEAISDFIRDKYKSTTGGDFPVQDKS